MRKRAAAQWVMAAMPLTGSSMMGCAGSGILRFRPGEPPEGNRARLQRGPDGLIGSGSRV